MGHDANSQRERALRAALAEVAAATGWECWVGVCGLLYARRRNASPPKVVRALDPAGLREAIKEAQQAHRAGQ